jgi:serine-type D-Ala-D-Ala carboxypeptidase (penicillin-binding protein 5/6)
VRRLALPVLLAVLGAGAPAARARLPPVSAPAAILVEASTGDTLYARHPDQVRAIASTTKLMTVLLALEHDPLTRTVSVPPYSIGSQESSIGLRTGERMTIADLVRAALLPSANDAAYTLAIRTAGSKARFVRLMNRRARQLGLTHTHYSTPVGLDTPGNHSSPRDLVRLAGVLRRIPFARRTMNEGRAVLRSGSHRRVVLNRNDLVRRVSWINGVKTGHTAAAGYVLVGSGTQRGMTLYSAVLGTSGEGTRDADSYALLSYGFRTFGLVHAVNRGAVLAQLRVKDVGGVRIPVRAARSVRSLMRRGTKIHLILQVPHELTGPLPKGAVVGHVVVRGGGRRLARVPLVAGRRVPEIAAATRIFRDLRTPAIFVGVLALIALAVAGESRRRRARRRRERRSRREAEPA